MLILFGNQILLLPDISGSIEFTDVNVKLLVELSTTVELCNVNNPVPDTAVNADAAASDVGNLGSSGAVTGAAASVGSGSAVTGGAMTTPQGAAATGGGALQC